MIFQRMKHYYQVYSGFISTSLSQAMSFRIHFMLLVVMDLMFYFVMLGSVDIIYNHVDKIGTWNRAQLMFFVSVMLVIDHLQMTFVSKNFWIFSYSLRTGELDFILLKPISAIFTTFFRHVSAGSLFIMLVPWYFVFYFGAKAGLDLIAWIFLVPLIFLGFVLIVSLEILISCAMFWMLEGTGINFLRMELQRLSRWPEFIYTTFVKRLLTFVVPVLLIGNPMVRFLFDHQDWFPLIIMLAAILLQWMILNFLWKIGLKAYESASS